MGSLLHLAYNVQYWPCIFAVLLVLLRVAPTRGGTTECQSSQPTGASAVLLQRASQLQTATEAVASDAPKGRRRLDHDGLEWQGVGGEMSLAQKSFTINNFVGSKSVRDDSMTPYPITFITVRDALFATNLGRSSLWVDREMLPHQWVTIDNWENDGISFLYASAQKVAVNDLMVFLHSDVILPEGWYQSFVQKLQQIEQVDPNWAVLGTAGVAEGWSPNVDPSLKISKIASSITDCFSTYYSGVDGLTVQSLDEHLLVLRRGSRGFDEHMPGFDLYGTDIVLAARQVGKKAYLLNVPVLHKTVDASGNRYDTTVWKAKVGDSLYQGRALATIRYLQEKWCSSGLLPVYGTAFDVLSCD